MKFYGSNTNHILEINDDLDNNLKNNNYESNKKNITNDKFYLSCLKILVYGVITPSIISFGIYYTFTIGIKHSIKNIVKEAINESIDLSFGKLNFKEIFKKIEKN